MEMEHWFRLSFVSKEEVIDLLNNVQNNNISSDNQNELNNPDIQQKELMLLNKPKNDTLTLGNTIAILHDIYGKPINQLCLSCTSFVHSSFESIWNPILIQKDQNSEYLLDEIEILKTNFLNNHGENVI